MNTKTIFTALLIFVLAGFKPLTGDQKSPGNGRFAVVDIHLVFNHFSKEQKAVIDLRKKRKDLKKEILLQSQKIKTLEGNFEAQKDRLNNREFRQKLSHIALEKEKLYEYTEKKNRELKNLEDSLKIPILKAILATIENTRKEKGLELILNRNDVLAYSLKTDLTQVILKQLKGRKLDIEK